MPVHPWKGRRGRRRAARASGDATLAAQGRGLEAATHRGGRGDPGAARRPQRLALGEEVVVGRVAAISIASAAVSRRHIAVARQGGGHRGARPRQPQPDDAGRARARRGGAHRGRLEVRLGDEVPMVVSPSEALRGAAPIEVAGVRYVAPLGQGRPDGGGRMQLERGATIGGARHGDYPPAFSAASPPGTSHCSRRRLRRRRAAWSCSLGYRVSDDPRSPARAGHVGRRGAAGSSGACAPPPTRGAPSTGCSPRARIPLPEPLLVAMARPWSTGATRLGPAPSRGSRPARRWCFARNCSRAPGTWPLAGSRWSSACCFATSTGPVRARPRSRGPLSSPSARAPARHRRDTRDEPARGSLPAGARGGAGDRGWSTKRQTGAHPACRAQGLTGPIATAPSCCTRRGSPCSSRAANRLERVNPLCVLLAHLHHLAKAAFADDLEQVEGLDAERLRAGGLEIDL